MSNNVIRTALWISVLVVVISAMITFSIIMYKIYVKKKEIRANDIILNDKIKNKQSEIEMMNRKDFGQAITSLQNLIGKTINHEIVEFCINTLIRNEYKNILLVGNVETYESISISNKTNAKVTVIKEEFDNDKYNIIKNDKNIVEHNLNIVDKLETKVEFDSIMCLNSTNDFDIIFQKYEKFLRKNGMFIFASVKSNKKSSKKLIKKVEEFNFRYDVINWYTGFITIVKSN